MISEVAPLREQIEEQIEDVKAMRDKSLDSVNRARYAGVIDGLNIALALIADNIDHAEKEH